MAPDRGEISCEDQGGCNSCLENHFTISAKHRGFLSLRRVAECLTAGWRGASRAPRGGGGARGWRGGDRPAEAREGSVGRDGHHKRPGACASRNRSRDAQAPERGGERAGGAAGPFSSGGAARGQDSVREDRAVKGALGAGDGASQQHAVVAVADLDRAHVAHGIDANRQHLLVVVDVEVTRA